MPSDSGATTSVWLNEPVPSFPMLESDCRADVCVIGAGIAGLSAAYYLTQVGRSVVVVDDGGIGSGETGRTTAHITHALDYGYSELERMHGENGTRLAAESHTTAIRQIEAIVRQEGIDCGFTRLDGYKFLAPGDAAEKLEQELGASVRAGLRNVQIVPRAPFEFLDTGPCLRYADQAQFHPLEYLSGLARAIARSGSQIYTGTHIVKVEGGNPCQVTTDGGAIVTADAVIVATNSPINEMLAVHTKQAPYRTYVIGVRVPRESVPFGLYWDTDDPYHYVRLQRESDSHDILIVGGEDHKTGQVSHTRRRFDRLEAWTRQRFPMAQDVTFRWSGQVMEPADGIAFIGHHPEDGDNVYVVTGHSGNGMTYGTLAGMLLRDLVTGRPNPWTELYQPGRSPVTHSFREFARENLDVAKRYTELLRPGEVSSTQEIPPGSGAILRHGTSMLAVYRDPEGVAHAYSALCQHARCVVHWNDTEQSWDCPCHGSRYDPHGHVINGPAASPLEPVHIPGVVPEPLGIPQMGERARVRPEPRPDEQRPS